MKYVLKIKSNKEYGKTVFVREKTGFHRNNYYVAVNLTDNSEEKVDFSWVKLHIKEIAHASICGTRLYYVKSKI